MVESQLLFGNYDNNTSFDLSILIPTYGRAKYLIEALDSVVNGRMKHHTYEIIVVSNSPEENFEYIIEKYKEVENLFLFRNYSNIGMVGNSNRCVELSRGEYFCFLHDDDYLLDNYFEVVEKYFFERETKAKCFITGRYLQFDNIDSIEYKHAKVRKRIGELFKIFSIGRGNIVNILPKDSLYANQNCYYSPSCGTIVEKKAFYEIGMFSNEIPYSWDFDFFTKLNLSYKVEAIHIPCSVYRLGSNASLRTEVKYDFYCYHSESFLKLLEEKNVGIGFIHRFRNEINYFIYHQWEDVLQDELKRNGKQVPYRSKKWLFYKAFTMIYFYFHRLDIQKIKL